MTHLANGVRGGQLLLLGGANLQGAGQQPVSGITSHARHTLPLRIFHAKAGAAGPIDLCSSQRRNNGVQDAKQSTRSPDPETYASVTSYGSNGSNASELQFPVST